MCLCTFISVLEWHFHCNYWANQLTSDGSVLACSPSLGNISFCFFFLFYCVRGKWGHVCGNKFISWHDVCVCVLPVKLVCLWCGLLICWDLGTSFLKDYHYDILCLPHRIQCQTDSRVGRWIERHLQGDGEEEKRKERGQTGWAECPIKINNFWNSFVSSFF